jgi:hypothetical protein
VHNYEDLIRTVPLKSSSQQINKVEKETTRDHHGFGCVNEIFSLFREGRCKNRAENRLDPASP